MYCFLTHLDYGLRTDGGIGYWLTDANYFDNRGYFVGRFFYEMGFFVAVIVILLSIVFGIIIDTFAELREESHEIEHDKKDVCFICGARRDVLEKNCQNYETHITKEHNVIDYINYIIGLKFVDPQETNAINSYVIEMVENKSISWFPSSKDSHSEHEEEE